MIAAIVITVKSALLVFAVAQGQPDLYCVVSDSITMQEHLYRNPEGGCKGLGRAIEADTKKQYKDMPVLLVVDGASTNDI